ncbi:hypothetical protein D7X48_11395 [bacterium D16-50]|nr:hypothetical protein D7X48_11395 [bacterium D16-50]
MKESSGGSCQRGPEAGPKTGTGMGPEAGNEIGEQDDRSENGASAAAVCRRPRFFIMGKKTKTSRTAAEKAAAQRENCAS